jgi:DNA-binding CsgD family transcriptional regulator
MLITLTEPAGQIRSPSESLPLPLSPGESAVVRLAVLGLSNPEIASRRGCSPRTVANHLASAYRKLGVSGRRALRAYLLDHGEQLALAFSKDEGS